jgi:hypothetical protein
MMITADKYSKSRKVQIYCSDRSESNCLNERESSVIKISAEYHMCV